MKTFLMTAIAVGAMALHAGPAMAQEVESRAIEAKNLAKSIKGLDKRLRTFDAYLGIDAFLKNFLVALPCVSDLRSPSIARRFAIAFEFFSFHSAPLMTTQRHSLAVRPHQPNFPSAAPFWSSDAAL